MSPSVEILEELTAQRAMAEEWDAAVPTNFARTLAQSAWYFAWRDAFPAGKNVIVTARENGRLVGVLPLSRVRTDARGLYLPQITTFTGGDYQAPVVAAGANPDVLAKMVDAGVEHFGRGAVYWLANIPTCDASAAALASHLRARGMRTAEQYREAARLKIDGRSFAQVEAAWSPSHRTDIRRQRKRLAAKGDLLLWEPADLPSAQTLLEEFFVVHDDKWLSLGQPGRFQERQQRAHFAAIVKRLWGRGLYFSALRCGDINVSFALGFVSDGWVQWYRPTYRREFHSFSPGKVHIAMVVEQACLHGWQGIDFLQGLEWYKLQWTNQQIRTVDYYATFWPWSPAYQWFTRGKPYMRDRLGPIYYRSKARAQNLLKSRRSL